MGDPTLLGTPGQVGWRGPGGRRAVGRTQPAPAALGVPWLQLHPWQEIFLQPGSFPRLWEPWMQGTPWGAQSGILARRELQEGSGMEARKHKCRIPERPMVRDQSQAANPGEAWLV